MAGALDDPIAGKGAAKWRSGKMNEKRVLAPFQLLCQDLEKEMTKQKKSSRFGRRRECQRLGRGKRVGIKG